MFELTEKFQGNEVFTLTLDSEPEKTKYWFRATQVCKVLDFKNTKETLEIHCKDWQYREFKVGNGRPAFYVCLSGLFRLTLRSKAPIAVEFQDWVSEDILPKLFVNSVVMTPNVVSNPEAVIQEWVANGGLVDNLMLAIAQLPKDEWGNPMLANGTKVFTPLSRLAAYTEIEHKAYQLAFDHTVAASKALTAQEAKALFMANPQAAFKVFHFWLVFWHQLSEFPQGKATPEDLLNCLEDAIEK